MNLFLAAEEANKIFLPGDVNEFWWGLGAFSIVMIFMGWKVAPAIIRMFRKTSDTIADEISDLEGERDKAVKSFNDFKNQLGDIGAEKQKRLGEARVKAEELEKSLVEKAEDEAADMKQRAKADIELTRRQAEIDLHSQIAEKVFRVTESAIKDSLDDKAHSKLISDYISNLSKAGRV